jgi:hypothetical protein
VRSRQTNRYGCIALAAALALAAASPAWAVIYGPDGQGGFNAYRMYDDDNIPNAAQDMTWDQARAFAETTSFMGVSGHLVTMGSDAENLFAANVGGSGITSMGQGGAGGADRWIGLTDATAMSSLDGFDPVATLGTFEAGNTSGQPLPPSGQVPVSGQRGFGWKWVDNTPFTAQAWGGGEPNDSGGEDAAHIRGDGLWNDQKAGTTIGESANNTGKRTLVEYDTHIPLFSQNQQLQAWQATVWKVQDVITPGVTVGNLTQAKEVIAGTRGPLEPSFNGGAPLTQQRTTINFSDGAATGFFTGDTQYPGFTGAQDNFAILAQGSFTANTGGLYTFGVNSDDGFGLIIRDADTSAIVGFQDWSGQNNGTSNDANQTWITNGELRFHNGRGHSSTATATNAASYGRINLAAGEEYDFDLVHWEGTGGIASLEAYWMLGTPTDYAPNAQGANLSFSDGTWTLLGNAGDLSPSGPFDVTTYKLFNQVNFADIGNMADADAVIAGTFATPLTQGFPKQAFYDVLNLNDADNNNAGNFAADEDPIFGVRGVDDVVLQATGLLVIPEAGMFTFGAFADDGVRLRLDINGDGVFDDSDNVFLQATANQLILSSVDLESGLLPVEVTWFERGGGAHLEIFSALGVHTSFDANEFRLVGDFANGGLLVLQQAPPIPEPATGALLVAAMGALGLRRRRRAA